MFGQVPLLIDGDKKIVQTRVIARYLATKLGLCGNGTEDDVLLCDQLFEGTEDIYEALWPACAKYRGGNSEQLEKVLAPGGNVHKYLVKFDKMLTDRTFLLGDSLTYADLALYNVLTVTSAIDVDQYLGQHFPNIRKHYSAVGMSPHLLLATLHTYSAQSRACTTPHPPEGHVKVKASLTPKP